MPRSNEDASKQGIFGGHGWGILGGAALAATAHGVVGARSMSKLMKPHGGFANFTEKVVADGGENLAKMGKLDQARHMSKEMAKLEGYDKSYMGRLNGKNGSLARAWGVTGGAIAAGGLIGGALDRD